MDTISKRTRNAVYDTHIHLVFVVKYRKEILTNEMLVSLEGYFRELCVSAGAELEEFNGEMDHVHLLVSLPPRLAVATLVNSLKGVSSRYLRRDYGLELEKQLGVSICGADPIMWVQRVALLWIVLSATLRIRIGLKRSQLFSSDSSPP